MNVLNKICDNILSDCRNNIEYIPRDNNRIFIQYICDIFNDKQHNKYVVRL